VRCWGDNGSGQLGDGTRRDRRSPVAVPGLEAHVVAISAGLAHTCALTERGRVRCWGNDSYGQLGDGDGGSSRLPVAVSDLGASVVAISAGEFHTCAVTEGSRPACWGSNDSGQLGDGTPTWRPSEVIGFP
jgi:alpha-tubulin suppressor-like RCC1 family protein